MPRNKYQIIEKAYELDLNKLDEGFTAADIFCHAENRNKARAKLFSIVKYDYWKLSSTGEELTRYNMPIFRAKKRDLVFFEGLPTVRQKIEKIIEQRHRLDILEKLAQNPDVSHCYIIKRGEYYRPNKCGYTLEKGVAGIYEKADAISEAKFCDEISLEPCLAPKKEQA